MPSGTYEPRLCDDHLRIFDGHVFRHGGSVDAKNPLALDEVDAALCVDRHARRALSEGPGLVGQDLAEASPDAWVARVPRPCVGDGAVARRRGSVTLRAPTVARSAVRTRRTAVVARAREDAATRDALLTGWTVPIVVAGLASLARRYARAIANTVQSTAIFSASFEQATAKDARENQGEHLERTHRDLKCALFEISQCVGVCYRHTPHAIWFTVRARAV